MEIKIFNTLIDRPLELSFQDKVLVQEECVKTPFSAILRLFDLLCSKACNIASDKMSNMHTILLYLPENNMLKALSEKVRLKDAVNEVPREKQENPPATLLPTPSKESAPQATEAPSGQDTDILKEINDYQEISFKTAPKSVILDKFLETAACSNVDNSPIEPVSVSESGKKSIQPGDSLNTETLALILTRQGKYDKAIEVYTNLMVQNPEKSATFAARIEEIKKQKDGEQ